MNSPCKTTNPAIRIHTGPVGTHGSCVRARHGLLFMMLASFAILFGGCRSKEKPAQPAVKASANTEAAAETAKEKERKAMLNRVGTIANDFRYIDSKGNVGSLHQLKAKHLMLIFYNPECPHCAPLLEKKAADPNINAAIKSGELTVLAVYAEGDRDVWEKTKKDMPEQWIVAYDLTGILDDELYDLPVMPIAYALSADKRVVIKDMPW